MTDYILVPVKKLKEWEATINTIALQTAFDVADDIARYASNKWIPTGGEKPELSDDTLVDVKFLNGHIEDGNSVNTWKWTQYGESYDITHYRIHQPVSAMQLEPDVSALAEALEGLRGAIEVYEARASLAAHRKGGE